MTKQLLFSSFIFFSLTLFNSCAYDYYVPSDAMLLGLEEKGDIKASAAYGTNGGSGYSNRNYSILAGYSPIKHLGMTANFFHFNNESGDAFARGQTGEVAIGTYISMVKTTPILEYSENTTLEKKDLYDVEIGENRQVTTFDVYAGYGYGNIVNQYLEGGRSNLSFERYFIQSAVHFNFNQRLKFSTGIKFLQIDYQKGLVQGVIRDYKMTLIRQIHDINPISMWEWMGRMEIGWPQLRIHGGFTVLSRWDNRESFSYVPLVISIGTTVDF